MIGADGVAVGYAHVGAVAVCYGRPMEEALDEVAYDSFVSGSGVVFVGCLPGGVGLEGGFVICPPVGVCVFEFVQ